MQFLVQITTHVKDAPETLSAERQRVASALRKLADDLEQGKNLVTLRDAEGMPIGKAFFADVPGEQIDVEPLPTRKLFVTQTSSPSSLTIGGEMPSISNPETANPKQEPLHPLIYQPNP